MLGLHCSKHALRNRALSDLIQQVPVAGLCCVLHKVRMFNSGLYRWLQHLLAGVCCCARMQVMAGLAAQAKQAGYQTLLISTDKDLWQVRGEGREHLSITAPA